MGAERDNKGRFVKGCTRIPPSSDVAACRKLGKAMIGGFLLEEFDTFCTTMHNMAECNPRAYAQCYIDLLAYWLPKISAVAYDADGGVEDPAVALLRNIADYNK